MLNLPNSNIPRQTLKGRERREENIEIEIIGKDP